MERVIFFFFFEILFLVELPLPYIRLKQKKKKISLRVCGNKSIDCNSNHRLFESPFCVLLSKLFCHSNILLLKQIVVAAQHPLSYRETGIFRAMFTF